MLTIISITISATCVIPSKNIENKQNPFDSVFVGVDVMAQFPGGIKVVEQMPLFPGGDIALFEFLSNNVKYPEICAEGIISGRVLTSFVIEKTGSLINIEIIKSVHPLLDAEASRVISIMPKWIHGKHKGEFVDVKFTLPINFRNEH